MRVTCPGDQCGLTLHCYRVRPSQRQETEDLSNVLRLMAEESRLEKNPGSDGYFRQTAARREKGMPPLPWRCGQAWGSKLGQRQEAALWIFGAGGPNWAPRSK